MSFCSLSTFFWSLCILRWMDSSFCNQVELHQIKSSIPSSECVFSAHCHSQTLQSPHHWFCMAEDHWSHTGLAACCESSCHIPSQQFCHIQRDLLSCLLRTITTWKNEEHTLMEFSAVIDEHYVDQWSVNKMELMRSWEELFLLTTFCASLSVISQSHCHNFNRRLEGI